MLYLDGLLWDCIRVPLIMVNRVCLTFINYACYFENKRLSRYRSADIHMYDDSVNIVLNNCTYIISTDNQLYLVKCAISHIVRHRSCEALETFLKRNGFSRLSVKIDSQHNNILPQCYS